MDSSVFFGVSTVAYIIAMVAYITYMAIKKPSLGLAATIMTITGFVTQTIALLIRWREFYELNQRLGIGRGFIEQVLRATPLTNLYESLIFFVWALILGYIVLEFRFRNRSFGAFVTPVAGLALAFIEMSGMSKEIQPLVPALQSNWLLIHVFMSFISYAGFALAFSTGLMYLIATTERKSEPSYIFWTLTSGVFMVVLIAMGLDFLKFRVSGMTPEELMKGYLFKATFLSRSPIVAVLSYIGAAGFLFAVWRYGHVFKKLMSAFNIHPDVLDEITYKSIAIGFPVFTLGGLIFGAIWADQAWGVYWSWDPKETWSLITWFVYAFFLHARLLRGWRGHKAAVIAVVGFVFVIFTYLGVNLLLSGLHAYGGG